MLNFKIFLAKVLGGTMSGTPSLLYLPESPLADPEAIEQLYSAP